MRKPIKFETYRGKEIAFTHFEFEKPNDFQFRIFVWKDQATLNRVGKKIDAKTNWQSCTAFSVVKYENLRRKYLGDVHFSLQNLDVDKVSHEIHHLTTWWCLANKRSLRNPKTMETMAHMQGNLTKQVWGWLKREELLPAAN